MTELATGTTAVVRMAVAPMHAEPRISSPQVSQRLAGHTVEVVSVDGDWTRARGSDGYEGWIHRGFLTPEPPGAARQSRRVPRVSLGCVARDPHGSRRALPLGAFLAPDELAESGEAVESTQLARRFPPHPAAICTTAVERFAGTSYQWGGITPWGADCSGLVQATFGLHGVVLPRDAWQQAETGVPGAKRILDAKPAELLFFSDRDDKRITHVGLALGDKRMVHLALGRGGYAIERLEDAGDAYVAKLVERFVGARRVGVGGWRLEVGG